MSKAQNTQSAYIQATKGQRYSVCVQNTPNRYVSVVITLNGRNILSVKKSWLHSNEKIYLLDPYDTALYKKWRTGKNRILSNTPTNKKVISANKV